MKNPKLNTIEELMLKVINSSNANDARFAEELAGELEAAASKPLPKLSISEAHVIEAIGEDADVSAATIAANSGMTRGGVSKILARLETKGYVTIERKDDNRKERKLSLTPQGELAFTTHEKLHTKKTARLLGLLNTYSDNELDVLVRMLTDFVESESL